MPIHRATEEQEALALQEHRSVNAVFVILTQHPIQATWTIIDRHPSTGMLCSDQYCHRP